MDKVYLSLLRSVTAQLDRLADHVDLDGKTISRCVAEKAFTTHHAIGALVDFLEHPDNVIGPANPDDEWLFDAVQGAWNLTRPLLNAGPGTPPEGHRLRSAARAIRYEYDQRQPKAKGNSDTPLEAHIKDIFPLGENRVDADVHAVALRIWLGGPTADRTKIARNYYREHKNCEKLVKQMTARIRRAENETPPRIILPKKRTKKRTASQ